MHTVNELLVISIKLQCSSRGHTNPPTLIGRLRVYDTVLFNVPWYIHNVPWHIVNLPCTSTVYRGTLSHGHMDTTLCVHLSKESVGRFSTTRIGPSTLRRRHIVCPAAETKEIDIYKKSH